MKRQSDRKADGKTGVLMIGVDGCVATTVITGVLAIAKGLAEPRGMITEDPVCQHLAWLPLDRLEIGGWDIRSLNVFDAAMENGVVRPGLVEALKDDLLAIPVMPGSIKSNGAILGLACHDVLASQRGNDCRKVVEAIVEQIEGFKSSRGLDRVVVVNLASTEPVAGATDIYRDLDAFEGALDRDGPEILAGMLFAYAALLTGCAYVNFTPSVTAEIPALLELAHRQRLPVCGKDGKTGQTLCKTVLAPMFRIRNLRVKGWYSTNLLGNNDGLILKDPHNLQSKLDSKLNVLGHILGYSDFEHQVHIHYYPIRGDAKESWDNIDFAGWLGEPMTVKVNWLGRDSILAAPLVVDLIRFMDLSLQRGEFGVQSHLAMFFKSPYGTSEHDFFRQYQMLLDYINGSRQ